MRPLSINYIFPTPSLAGGIKSSRLIAEAMVRRGHDVRLIYPTQPPALPNFWRVRTFLRQWRRRREMRGHHLLESSARLMPVNAAMIGPKDVPDADGSMAPGW